MSKRQQNKWLSKATSKTCLRFWKKKANSRHYCRNSKLNSKINCLRNWSIIRHEAISYFKIRVFRRVTRTETTKIFRRRKVRLHYESRVKIRRLMMRIRMSERIKPSILPNYFSYLRGRIRNSYNHKKIQKQWLVWWWRIKIEIARLTNATLPMSCRVIIRLWEKTKSRMSRFSLIVL